MPDTIKNLHLDKNMCKTKGRILVVDDEPTQREMLKKILDCEGYDAITAVDGHDALKVLEVSTAGVILSDLKMPRMDGMQLLSAIRGKYPDTAFIMITAHPSYETRMEALNKGARGYMCKPIDVEELCREIADALQG
jgi:DNA-binding NtrC family response regulator